MSSLLCVCVCDLHFVYLFKGRCVHSVKVIIDKQCPAISFPVRLAGVGFPPQFNRGGKLSKLRTHAHHWFILYAHVLHAKSLGVAVIRGFKNDMSTEILKIRHKLSNGIGFTPHYLQGHSLCRWTFLFQIDDLQKVNSRRASLDPSPLRQTQTLSASSRNASTIPGHILSCLWLLWAF